MHIQNSFLPKSYEIDLYSVAIMYPYGTLRWNINVIYAMPFVYPENMCDFSYSFFPQNISKFGGGTSKQALYAWTSDMLYFRDECHGCFRHYFSEWVLEKGSVEVQNIGDSFCDLTLFIHISSWCHL